uniref:Uncharacterized protein n=1 Tax=Picea sitchensis TaxID=3332 RepID=D5A7Z5_PICSI|nr:unknown [Picea sitchensis]
MEVPRDQMSLLIDNGLFDSTELLVLLTLEFLKFIP